MENMFYLNTRKTKINEKEFYCIAVLDLNRTQIFYIYKLVDNCITNFIHNLKTFDNISSKLTFKIKSDKKITLDIK